MRARDAQRPIRLDQDRENSDVEEDACKDSRIPRHRRLRAGLQIRPGAAALRSPTENAGRKAALETSKTRSTDVRTPC